MELSIIVRGFKLEEAQSTIMRQRLSALSDKVKFTLRVHAELSRNDDGYSISVDIKTPRATWVADGRGAKLLEAFEQAYQLLEKKVEHYLRRAPSRPVRVVHDDDESDDGDEREEVRWRDDDDE